MGKVFKDYDFILQTKFLDEVSKYVSKYKLISNPGEVGFKVNNRYIKVYIEYTEDIVPEVINRYKKLGISKLCNIKGNKETIFFIDTWNLCGTVIPASGGRPNYPARHNNIFYYNE